MKGLVTAGGAPACRARRLYRRVGALHVSYRESILRGMFLLARRRLKALHELALSGGGAVAEIMELTFVNAISAPSLAVLVPVITRALRETGTEAAMNGCMTSCNIFGLVCRGGRWSRATAGRC
jgi:hypothetical protein